MTWLLLVTYLALQGAFIATRFGTFRLGGGPSAGVHFIEASVLASLLAGALLILSRPAPHAGWDLAALGLGALSATLFAWAKGSVRPQQLDAAFTSGAPAELVTSGAFGFVRNPFYTAYMLGHALPLPASRSAWALLPALWMVAIYVRATLQEEQRFLAGPLADEWRRYAGVTGRYLPRLR